MISSISLSHYSLMPLLSLNLPHKSTHIVSLYPLRFYNLNHAHVINIQIKKNTLKKYITRTLMLSYPHISFQLLVLFPPLFHCFISNNIDWFCLFLCFMKNGIMKSVNFISHLFYRTVTFILSNFPVFFVVDFWY